MPENPRHAPTDEPNHISVFCGLILLFILQLYHIGYEMVVNCDKIDYVRVGYVKEFKKVLSCNREVESTGGNAMAGVPLLVTVAEAAEMAGIGRSTAYQLCQNGAWPVVKIGRAVRINKRKLEEWVEEHTGGTGRVSVRPTGEGDRP
jgi:excisionase family DNA binding protein